MLDEGPRDAAGVLRFPRGALGSLAHDEPHRKRLRDRQAQNGADERLAIINNCQADGVQAAQRRIKDLAAVERNKSVAKGHWRCQIPRWHRGHRSAGKLRRLIASSPKIPHSSGNLVRTSLSTGYRMCWDCLRPLLWGPLSQGLEGLRGSSISKTRRHRS